jgi:hypothetical protein
MRNFDCHGRSDLVLDETIMQLEMEQADAMGQGGWREFFSDLASVIYG